jgi:hypothetical protein
LQEIVLQGGNLGLFAANTHYAATGTFGRLFTLITKHGRSSFWSGFQIFRNGFSAIPIGLNTLFFFVRGCRLAELRYETIDPNQFLLFSKPAEKRPRKMRDKVHDRLPQEPVFTTFFLVVLARFFSVDSDFREEYMTNIRTHSGPGRSTTTSVKSNPFL